MTTEQAGTLECVECGAVDDSGIGWKAYLDDEDDIIGIYCANCAEREFGD